MRGTVPGENKFPREIAKTEFSQQGHKRSDHLKQEEREEQSEENYSRSKTEKISRKDAKV
jgi:hypothetical protein